jgi:L-fuculose-phosphate aldolase
VTAGESFQQAFRRFETFEFTGKTIIKARLLNREVRYLTDAEIELGARPRGVPTFERTAATSAEKDLRGHLRDFVHRAYRLRLFISTQGSFSARLAANSFIITPSQVDRERLAAEDLALVVDGRADANSTPSRAASLHDAIYNKHPQVGAIINAYPVNATAFSVTGAALETRTIPESYVVVRKLGTASYASQFEDPETISALIAPMQPALLVENGGVLVTGKDILEAYDRLEVLEATAEAIINSRALGAMAPMSDEVIQDLEVAFFKC